MIIDSLKHLSLTLMLSALLIGSASADYNFPRDDGEHFTFESNWENRFDRNQHDENQIVGEHGFSIRGLDPVYIEFKRLAMDGNSCYNNKTWKVTVIVQAENISETVDVSESRSDRIQIEPLRHYSLTVVATYNGSLMRPGTYRVMTQMNVVGDDTDEPHYFFETISFDIKEPDDHDDNWLLFLAIGIMASTAILIWKAVKVRSGKRPPER